MEPVPESQKRSLFAEWRVGTKLALIFLAFSVPYIVLSDLLVVEVWGLANILPVQMVKGLGFVSLCAIGLKLLADWFVRDRMKIHMRQLRLADRLSRAESVALAGSWEKNLTTGKVHVSDGLRDVLNCELDLEREARELLIDCIHDEDHEKVISARDAVVAGGGPSFFSYRVRLPSGDIRWIEERTEIRRDDGEGFEWLIGTIQDVTEIMQARAQARENEALMRLAEEKARVGGWRHVLGADSEHWTEGVSRIRGLTGDMRFSPDEALAAYTPASLDRLRDCVAECAKGGHGFDQIFELTTETEEILTVRVIGEAERRHDGQIIAVHGAVQDVTALISAQKKAHQRNADFENLLSAIGAGVIRLSANMKVDFLNQRGGHLLGLEPDSVSEMRLQDVFSAAENSRLFEGCRATVASGRPFRSIEYNAKKELWLEVNVYPAGDGAAVFFRDYTDQQAAQDWSKMLENVVQTADDIIIISEVAENASSAPTSGKLRLIYANKSFEVDLGHRISASLGQAPWAFLHDSNDPAVISALMEEIDAGRPAKAEVLVALADGSNRWYEMQANPIVPQNNDASYWMAVLRDRTESKEFEQRLLQSEERFRLVSRASSDVIWDWDILSGHFWLSENYEDVFGFDISKDDETLEVSLARVHPDDRDRISHSLHEAVASDASIWGAEYRVQRADGSFAIIEDKAFIMRDETGRATRMVAGMTDVTEMRQMDKDLQLARKLEAVGHLTGSVAHDFNNLLTIVLSTADLMLDSELAPADQEKVEAIINAAERGAELTDGLLAFSRRQPLEPIHTDVNALIRESTPLFRRSTNGVGELKINLRADRAVVNVDPARLQSTILNLLINSRHALTDHGRISIETTKKQFDASVYPDKDTKLEGTYVCIAVSDNGSGMPQDVLDRAFEPFFSTKPAGKGNGMGLSSAYGFAKQSGGAIRIYTEVGFGTTVRLYLPVSDGDPAEVFEEPILSAKGTGQRVLVVEDDADLRAHARDLIAHLGYTVMTASSAEEALQTLDDGFELDVLFTDVILRGPTDGAELARAIKERVPGVKILFTSGYTENAILHGGALDHGVDLLTKPYRNEELMHSLAATLMRE